MDIGSIKKKLGISTFKCFILRIFGGRSAVYDYIAEKGLDAVNALLETHAEGVREILAKMAAINGYAERYAKYLPSAWLPYAERLNAALRAVYDAASDGVITSEEGSRIVNEFRAAYCHYMAD